jgi:hypothetical protein
MASTTKMKKIVLAMPEAATKTPVYPKIAAIMAMIKNIKAQVNIELSPFHKLTQVLG